VKTWGLTNKEIRGCIYKPEVRKEGKAVVVPCFLAVVSDADRPKPEKYCHQGHIDHGEKSNTLQRGFINSLFHPLFVLSGTVATFYPF